MLNKAIEKIKSEMDKNKDSNIKVIGNFLLQYLNLNPEAAEQILSSDKTIEKSIGAMRQVAEKAAKETKKTGHVTAVIPDSEGFEIILNYYGITGSAPAPVKVEAAAGNFRPHPPVPVQKPSVDFDINLEDLLL